MPKQARMRRSEDFRRTVRHGVRAGRRTVVVHALPAAADAAGAAPAGPEVPGSLVGFVVAKSIGSAVRRNRVRRRLRHLCQPHLRDLPRPTLLVVRALPPAATAGRELDSDLAAAWTAALARLARRSESDRR